MRVYNIYNNVSGSDWLGGVVFNTSNPYRVDYTIRLDAVPRLAAHSEPKVKDWRTRVIYSTFLLLLLYFYFTLFYSTFPLLFLYFSSFIYLPQWVYPVFQVIGPREINNSFGGDPGYFREGFLALQHAIDRAIIMNATKKFPAPVVMKRMPYPQFELDGFIYVLENTLPFLFLIAFLAMNINCVRSVVTEKEKRIKVSCTIIAVVDCSCSRLQL